MVAARNPDFLRGGSGLQVFGEPTAEAVGLLWPSLSGHLHHLGPALIRGPQGMGHWGPTCARSWAGCGLAGLAVNEPKGDHN